MLIDVRTYTCKPGTLKAHLDLYAAHGKGPQSKHLGQPLAYMITETGNPNQYVHIWVYESAGDREARRAAMWADPDWLAYTKMSAELGALIAQENKLMKPVDFFPFQHA
ncbi:MAG: NIPSNAP family protein [Pseudomonadota bacterium]